MAALPSVSPVIEVLKSIRQRSIIGLTLGSSVLAGFLTLTAQAPTQASTPLADGRYLYGEAQQAGVAGSTYLLMQVRQNRVVGAFYQPSSSFDCFHGSLSNTSMDVAIVDSYEQTSHPYQLAVNASPTSVASSTGAAGAVQIEGFHQLLEMSSADQSILNTCLVDHPL